QHLRLLYPDAYPWHRSEARRQAFALTDCRILLRDYGYMPWIQLAVLYDDLRLADEYRRVAVCSAAGICARFVGGYDVAWWGGGGGYVLFPKALVCGGWPVGE